MGHRHLYLATSSTNCACERIKMNIEQLKKPDIKCAKCGVMMNWLEVFPQDYCLKCHAEREKNKPLPSIEEIMKMFGEAVEL